MRGFSFEYPQHMFVLRNKKINFYLHSLILRPELPYNTVNFDIIFKQCTCRNNLSHNM